MQQQVEPASQQSIEGAHVAQQGGVGPHPPAAGIGIVADDPDPQPLGILERTQPLGEPGGLRLSDPAVYNPHGAPELYFTKSAAWGEFQHAIINAVEPLRCGRLREMDPSGIRILDLVNNTSEKSPQRQQLLRYGYDEIADEVNGGHDRFHPHVTPAWPRDSNFRVPLDNLPLPPTFNGLLSELALFGMSGYGTCTKSYGIFPLKRR
ncbi:MAG: hypothetical protein ACRDTC_19875 [Pseudonocardiaceae bacterium]